MIHIDKQTPALAEHNYVKRAFAWHRVPFEVNNTRDLFREVNDPAAYHVNIVLTSSIFGTGIP